jgi:hypothetical protein
MRESVPGLWLAALVAALSCCPQAGSGQTLAITGLPCPGGEGEPTNSHPLIWTSGAHSRNWADTVPIHYGDLVSVTWYDQCRAHSATWNFARLDLIYTNGAGTWQTNSATLSMQSGYNFGLSFVYWFTNNGDLVPTSFDAARVAVQIGNNRTPVLSVPAPILGTSINPPLWSGSNPVTNAAELQLAPALVTNGDGGIIINPVLQLPFLVQEQTSPSDATLVTRGLPGNYGIESSSDLRQPWSAGPQLVLGPDGTAATIIPLDAVKQSLPSTWASMVRTEETRCR